ncbi:hypothetical protein Bbelb_235700 [Branchiostoma belcheri]|nr:hypothetical protein Bbelb_235700 [Branchiostoma belcheri]
MSLQFQSKPLGGPNSRHLFPSTRATFHPNFVTLACLDHEISKPEVQLQYRNKPLGGPKSNQFHGTRSVACQDSNSGPLGSESSTLPLRHTTPPLLEGSLAHHLVITNVKYMAFFRQACAGFRPCGDHNSFLPEHSDSVTLQQGTDFPYLYHSSSHPSNDPPSPAIISTINTSMMSFYVRDNEGVSCLTCTVQVFPWHQGHTRSRFGSAEHFNQAGRNPQHRRAARQAGGTTVHTL